MFGVFRETMGIDEDLAATHDEFDYFDDYDKANELASELTKLYKGDDWKGFKWYKDKFYVAKIEYEQALRNKRMLEGRQMLANWW